MACDQVTLPGSGRAIVCSSHKRQRCPCGRPATRLCDWKTETKRGTCSAPLCVRCTTMPNEEKDLCAKHARAFDDWKAGRAAAGQVVSR